MLCLPCQSVVVAYIALLSRSGLRFSAFLRQLTPMAPKLAAPKRAMPARVQPDQRVTKAPDVQRRAYLVTIPHPRAWRPAGRLLTKTASDSTGGALASPGDMTRADIEKAFLDAARRPVYEHEHLSNRAAGVELEQMAVFMELHEPKAGDADDVPRLPHYHVALQAKRSFRFLPFKRALRARHGLATHWSCDHTGYFSAVRYCALPTPTKPQSELDPEPRLWAAHGLHKPLFEACQEPTTAAALQQRRENRVRCALEHGKAEPRATEMDLYAAIVRGGYRNNLSGLA